MKVLIYIAAALGACALITLLSIEQGWVISTLWSWFLVPLGAPEISVAAAIGISLTLSAILMRKKNRDDADKWWAVAAARALAPLAMLGAGWIVKQFA